MSTRKSKLSLFIFTLFFTSSLLANQRLQGIEKKMQTTREAWSAPGMAVAVVNHDRIVWMGAVGYENVETETKASSKTLWRIASLSKSVTSVAIMQLVEANKIKLDEPIWTYLPWYPRKGDNVITVRNLLTHTSGIRHYREGEMENTTSFSSVAAGAKIYGIDDEPLQFKPGTHYLYSSYAYALLAAIIEKVSGLTYEVYLREHIFKPAGMATARLDKNRDIILHRAGAYRKDAITRDIINAPYVDVSYKWSAGGILASVEDLAHFAIALDQHRLLSAKSLAEMYKPNRLADGTTTQYGLGWRLLTEEEGKQWVSHSGGATGGAAYLLRAPKEGFAIVMACNLENPGDIKKAAMDFAHDSDIYPKKRG